MAKVLDTIGKALGSLPFVRKANLSARYEIPNVASNAKVSEIQSMIRAAEQGDPSRLFAYYRDLLLSGSHVQSEFAKRKLAILGDTLSVMPCDKENPDDVRAADACKEAIENCENWLDAMTFMMDSCLYPVSVMERLYQPAEPAESSEVRLRYTLKRFEPVNYSLLCFRGPYQLPNPPEGAPVEWEADLRLWPTDASGQIIKDVTRAQLLDPMRHIVHRGHLLIGVRDSWGGPMRSIIFWDLLAKLGRDWFGRMMERYGNPFIVSKVDKTDKDAVTFLQEALSLATKIGGLVVDTETEVELKEAMLSGAADGYEKFLGVCHREISKVVVGQDLSAQSAPTGLGSGVANLQAGVRQDIRMFDQLKLAETIEKQVFKPFLKVNGLKGSAKIRWGGLSPEEAAATGALLVNLANANLEPTDDSINVISERIGFAVQRKAVAPPAPGFGGFGANGPKTFSTDDGRWVTINGTPIFIADGESLDVAIDKKFGAAKKNRKATIQQTAAALEKQGIKLGPSETKPDANGKWTTRYKITHKNGKQEDVSVNTLQHLVGFSAGNIELKALSSQNGIASSLGVPATWLNPLQDYLAEIEAKVADKSLTDADLLNFLDRAIARVPELFKDMKVDDLAEMLAAGMGDAVLQEVRRGIKKQSSGE